MDKRIILIAFPLLLAACGQSPSEDSSTSSLSSGVNSSTIIMAASSMGSAEYIQPQNIRTGQMIGTMEVVSNDYQENNIESKVRFRGKVTITGEYWDAGAEGGMGPRGICIDKLDIQSKIGLPMARYADAKELERGMPRLTVQAAKATDYVGAICFTQEEAIQKGLQKGTRGRATVVIDNFFLELSGLEGKTNTGTLVEVIAAEAKKAVKNVE